MSYESIVTGLKTHLESASGFSSDTVTIGGELLWAQGVNLGCIIQQNPQLVHEWQAFANSHKHIWSLTLVVGARWTGVEDGPNALRDAWQAIIDRICAFPDLGDLAGVMVAEVVAADLEPIHIEVGGAKFALVNLTVRVEEDVTYAET